MWDLMSPPKILGAVCRKEEYKKIGHGPLDDLCGFLLWTEVRKINITVTLLCSHYLLSELDDQRQLVGLDKSQEVFFGQLSIEGIAIFIKL